MSVPDPFASVVTARDVYGAVQEMRGEMRSTTAEVRSVKDDITALKKSRTEHERRIQRLEHWRARWPLSTLTALIGGLAALAAAVVQILT